MTLSWIKTKGVVGVLVPSSADAGQILLFSQGGRRLLLSKLFDVLFRCTLERALCHINQSCSECRAMLSVYPKASAYSSNDLLGEKKSFYICSFNLSLDPTSWCQLIICPLNLILFPCAKTLGTENQGPYIYICSYGPTPTHTHKLRCNHTQINTLADALLLSVSAENQTVHPSACVIPSNQSYVAMVKISPHEPVNQAAAAA